ncbi:uncharacterized protein LOC114719846 [Neltuma alba]|uniref:uncharacterized protein LOC114719846 n=1 Tax=Neltuma alba TaxID=207710 RepID=UPI0010A4904B|nr:uncharacterized protein LOC114719846 [Prosopis alba]
MANQTSEKSRRERRKEARLAKKANKHQSWLDDQISRAMKRVNQDSEANTTCKSNHLLSPSVKETKVNKSESNSGRHSTAEDCEMSKEITESKSMICHGSVATIMKKGNKGSKENSRKKSRCFPVGVPDVSIAAKKIKIWKETSQKLKVKDGKLRVWMMVSIYYLMECHLLLISWAKGKYLVMNYPQKIEEEIFT